MDACVIGSEYLKDAFLIGFLGRFMEQKGFLYLIDALDRLLASGTLNRPAYVCWR